MEMRRIPDERCVSRGNVFHCIQVFGPRAVMHVRAAGAGDYCRCTPKFEALVRSGLWRGGCHGSTTCRKRFSVKRTLEWYPIHPMP